MSSNKHRGAGNDVVVVGAGLGGIAVLHALRSRGIIARVLEAGAGPGGTWYWNRYPGARCDIESLQYSLSVSVKVQADWVWSEKFATQPEILAYIEHLLETEDLRQHCRFDCRVTSAVFDSAAQRWTLRSAQGEVFEARHCVMATGTLSMTYTPDFLDLTNFRGECYHTGSWPHAGVDVRHKRVGVIGTGSSGIQIIPQLALQAEHLTVFQRSAPYCVPARNRPLSEQEITDTKREYSDRRKAWRALPNATGMNFGTKSAMQVSSEERRAVFEAAWQAGGADFGACFNDLTRRTESNAEVTAYFRWKIAGIVKHPDVAEKLMPGFAWGTRRLCIGTNYYETYNRPNVLLVNLRTAPIEGLISAGLRAGGVDYPLDILVFATGYDAITGALLRMDIRGRDDLSLRDAWRAGPRTYLGLMTNGFPNMFMISGPQSPGTLINMALGSEVQGEWIAKCIAYLYDHGIDAIEAKADAQDSWVEQAAALAAKSMMSKGESWWVGANIPGKPRGYLGYLDWPGYDAKCIASTDDAYADFSLLRAEPSRRSG